MAMAKINLSRMDLETLVNLRQQVQERLHEHRATLEEQLESLGRLVGSSGATRAAPGNGRRSILKGKKVAPKYRGPSGETWAGRGARPRWLVAAIKGGKKADDFLIRKSPQNGRKNRRSKR